MLIEATIQRIGGSTFARLPPTAVKKLQLHAGDTVQLSILKEGKTLRELSALVAPQPGLEWREARRFSKVDE